MLEALKAKFAALYEAEPARVNAAVVALVMAGATAIGVVVSAPVVLAFVAFLAPVLVAELTRPKVVPVANLEGVATPLTHRPLPPESLGP